MLAGKIELEYVAIRTICAGKDAGLVLLNNLSLEHFNYQTTKLMYRRLMARLKGEGNVPAWNDLINDPTIPEEKRMNAQRQVRVKKLKPEVSKAKGDALFDSLDRYRKLRAVFEVLNKGGNTISQPTADIDSLIKTLKSDLISIDTNQRGAPIVVDGVKSKHVKESLTNIDARIATGFDEFDEKSGGIPQGAVFLLGAESGQYKSVMAIQLSKNIAKDGRTENLFSLEMPQPEITQRMTANELEIAVSDEIGKWQWLRRKAKTAKERDAIDAKHFAWADKVAAEYEEATKGWADFLHTTCPADGVDITWILQQAEMSDREVIFIDYLGLLEGLSGDDQWRAMSNAARQCKIWTNRTGKTVVLLAQMRFEDGKPDLKYSRAVKDHVNNMWAWQVLEVDGRTYLCVHQGKARGTRTYHFVLRVWPEFNKIGNLVDAKDDEVAMAAVADMKVGKDPNKRYAKAVDGNAEAGRKEIGLDDDEPMLQDGGFGGKTKVRARDLSPPWQDDSKRSLKERISNAAVGVSSSAILKNSELRRRAMALSKLDRKTSNISLEEAAIQADEVIKRWEEASQGHRLRIGELSREILGLSQTKEVLTNIRRLQGDKAALRKLSKQELEVHRAQVAIVKAATETIKTKGREYVSEEDFYAKDDLTLAMERGEEPIADPLTLDRPWELNAVAWADQPAITLPNSAKPEDKRWGANGEEESVKRYKKTAKAYDNSGQVKARLSLWPPAKGELSDFHYLDDIQLDEVVTIASKYAVRPLDDVPLDTLVNDVTKYIELVGPGLSRVHNRKREKLSDARFKRACKRFGLEL